MSEWMPIESAPMDGTNVLLSIKYGGVPVVAEFSHGRWWANTEHYDVSCSSYCYGGTVCTEGDLEPTHWMPLPEPPK